MIYIYSKNSKLGHFFERMYIIPHPSSLHKLNSRIN